MTRRSRMPTPHFHMHHSAERAARVFAFGPALSDINRAFFMCGESVSRAPRERCKRRIRFGTEVVVADSRRNLREEAMPFDYNQVTSCLCHSAPLLQHTAHHSVSNPLHGNEMPCAAILLAYGMCPA